MKVLKVMAMISFGITSPRWLQLSRLQHMSNRLILFQYTVEPHHTTTLLLYSYSFNPNMKITESFYYLKTLLVMWWPLLWPQFYGPIMVTLTEFHYVIKIYTWAKENWFLFFNSPQALGFNTLKLVLWKTLMSGKNWNCLSSCSNCWKGGL